MGQDWGGAGVGAGRGAAGRAASRADGGIGGGTDGGTFVLNRAAVAQLGRAASPAQPTRKV